jgi:hypothetical protein
MQDFAVLGIDPGKSGGLALFMPSATIPQVWAVAQTPRDVWDQMKSLIAMAGPTIRVMLESVHSMPTDGGKASFTFGKWVAYMEICLIGNGVPYEVVKPKDWQSKMECLTGGDKNISKQRAQALFPTLSFTHATAEASLIAEYARRLWLGIY